MSSNLTVFVVDDDDAVRKTLARSLEFQGYTVETFDSGTKFLESDYLLNYGCIVMDIAMPGMSGLEVQSELSDRGSQIPIIFMTGHGDVPTSVQALKSGAIEFLEKPFQPDIMLERIDEALKLDEARYQQDQTTAEIKQRFETLTKREKDVMASLAAGRADRSNKEVARELDISYRTVEEYRSRIFNKMEATSITHLVEMAKVCGVYKS